MNYKVFILFLILLQHTDGLAASLPRDSSRHKTRFSIELGKNIFFEKALGFKKSGFDTVPDLNPSAGIVHIVQDSLEHNDIESTFYPTDLAAMVSYRGIFSRTSFRYNSLSKSALIEMGYGWSIKSRFKLELSALYGISVHKTSVRRFIYESGYCSGPNCMYYTMAWKYTVLGEMKMAPAEMRNVLVGGRVGVGCKLSSKWDLFAAYGFNFRNDKLKKVSALVFSQNSGLALRYNFGKAGRTAKQKVQDTVEKFAFHTAMDFKMNLYNNEIFVHNSPQQLYYDFLQNSYLSALPANLVPEVGFFIRRKHFVRAFYTFEAIRYSRMARMESDQWWATWSGPVLSTSNHSLGFGYNGLFRTKKEYTFPSLGISYCYGRNKAYVEAHNPMPVNSIQTADYVSSKHTIQGQAGFFFFKGQHMFLYMGLNADLVSYASVSYKVTQDKWNDMSPSSPHQYIDMTDKISGFVSLGERQQLLSLSMKFGYAF